MQNKVMELFSDNLYYVPDLRELTGSINAAILMQQLDDHFIHSPEGFYKFKKPSGHLEYQVGDSWTETLNFSAKEFDNAWRHIGTTYASKTAYNRIKVDKFQGKLYCAYIDRRQNNKTYYFRNHQLIHQRLESLPQSEALVAYKMAYSEKIVV